MLIRDARPDDLEQLVRLLDQDAIREVTEDLSDLRPYAAALEEILAAPHSTVLVGEIDGQTDGEIVATAQVTWQRRLMYGAGVVCQVESVRVSSRHRSGGLGGELIRWVIDDARRRKCTRIELTSNAQRVDARRFYERLGFRASHIGMKLYLQGRKAPHDGSPSRAGQLPIGGRDRGTTLLRGAARADRGRQAPGAGGSGRCLVPRRGLRAARRGGGGVSPGRQGHPAFLVDDADALAGRLTGAGVAVGWDDSFPGYRRFHTQDLHGNRVEILQDASIESRA